MTRRPQAVHVAVSILKVNGLSPGRGDIIERSVFFQTGPSCVVCRLKVGYFPHIFVLCKNSELIYTQLHKGPVIDQDRVKPFAPPPPLLLKGGNVLPPPPPHYG